MSSSNKAALIEQIRQRSWNLRSFSVPPELGKVPTMLTREECRMLAWIAGAWPEGSGAVLDLGTFLGGSTAHLAYGLSRACPGQAVHAYDLFQIDEPHKKAYLYDRGYPRLEGTDMLPLFEAFVRPFGKAIPHPGSIEQAAWSGGPIEILFVDIMKGWAGTHHVMRTFYPSLLPGESLVIHQDYQHFQHPWVPATTQFLRDHLSFVGYTAEYSAIFLCTQPIDVEAVDAAIAATKDIEVAKRLIAEARDQFPHARQREAMQQHIEALTLNPKAQYAWDLRLG